MIGGTNVLPGDLAMVVSPYCEPGRGAVVEVLRRAEPVEVIRGITFTQPSGHIGWLVEGWVTNDIGLINGPTLVIGDRALRKIGFPCGQDEMLQIAGLPPVTGLPRSSK